MVEDASLQRFMIAPPLRSHCPAGAENLVDRNAEPLHDASIDESKREQEQAGRRDERERHQPYENGCLEFRARLLLFSFRPDFHQGAQQHEPEDQKNQECESR